MNRLFQIILTLFYCTMILFCGDNKLSGSTSEVINPKVSVSFVDDKGNNLIKGSVAAYPTDFNPYLDGGPIFTKKLSNDSQFLITDSLVMGISSIGPLKIARSINLPVWKFNLWVETQDNQYGYVDSLHYDSKERSFYRKGEIITDLFIALSSSSLEISVDTLSLPTDEIPMMSYIPGTPVNGNNKFQREFILTHIPNGVFPIRIISDSFYVYQVNDLVSTDNPQNKISLGMVESQIISNPEIDSLLPKIELSLIQSNDSLIPGDTLFINWVSHSFINSILLETSMDTGINWVKISHIPINQEDSLWGNYFWVVPDSLGLGSETGDSLIIKAVFTRISDYFDIEGVKVFNNLLDTLPDTNQVIDSSRYPKIESLLSDTSLTQGDSLKLSPQISGELPIEISWFINDTLYSSNSELIINPIFLNHHNNRILLIVKNTLAEDTSRVFTLNVLPSKPTIEKQPQNQFVNESELVLFSITALGSNLFYQWYKNGFPISGANFDTLQFQSTFLDNDSKFWVEINNTSGLITSDTVQLQVNLVKPEIIVEPQNQSGFEGDSIELNVSVKGSEINYQWFQDTSIIPNALDSFYKMELGPADSGSSIWVEVINFAGKDSSRMAEIQVHLIQPVIIQEPQNQVTLEGNQLIYFVQANGSQLKYQWYKNDQPLPGKTKDSLELIVQIQDNADNYWVEVSNSGGSDTSNMVTVQIRLNPPSITSEPVNKSILEFGNVNFSVTADGTNISYQWVENGMIMNGEISNQLNLSSLPLEDNGKQFYVIVSNSGGMDTSNTVSLTVRKEITITNPILGQNYKSYSDSSGGPDTLPIIWSLDTMSQISSVFIEASGDSGNNWHLLNGGSPLANTHQEWQDYKWILDSIHTPNSQLLNTNFGRVRIRDAQDSLKVGVSDIFRIAP